MNPIKHVAIIMDGNGRWGIKNKKSRNFGHKEGLKSVENIIKVSIDNKIKFLTLFVFSTENWKRPKKEIKFLFKLLKNFLTNKTNKLRHNGIKLKIIGDKRVFSKRLNRIINNSEKVTKNNKNLQINLALNYGSKNELIKAFKKIKKKNLPITENNVDKNLFTSGIPEPEILIRTGYTKRLSNFLLWQLAYSEIFFVDKLWPEFNKKDFCNIIKKFRKIKRNFGKI